MPPSCGHGNGLLLVAVLHTAWVGTYGRSPGVQAGEGWEALRGHPPTHRALLELERSWSVLPTPTLSARPQKDWRGRPRNVPPSLSHHTFPELQF